MGFVWKRGNLVTWAWKSEQAKQIKKADTIKTTTAKKPDSIKNTPVPKSDTNGTTKGIVFKVQLSASAKKLELTPINFKGLNAISVISTDNLYKYMYGETSNYEEAKNLLQEAKSKGYATAYLIAFKNGKSISIQDAIK